MKRGIELNLSNNCNLNCDYCYVKHNESEMLSIHDINSILKIVRDNTNVFTNHCTFFGGEPSLHHNMINYVMDENKDFTYSIVSNGYRLFHKGDIDFYRKFNHVTITLEGTELAYKELRGEHNLNDKLSRILDLKRYVDNISINMSVNGLLLQNMNEFIINVKLLLDHNIDVVFYSIKGDNKFNDISQYIQFLDRLKELSYYIFKMILRLTNDYNQNIKGEYLCTFGDKISIHPSGQVITCNSSDECLGNYSDLNSYIKITDEVEKNKKIYWIGCNNCDVDVSICGVSCPTYINQCYKNNKLGELNHVCDFERVKEFYRRKEMNNGD